MEMNNTMKQNCIPFYDCNINNFNGTSHHTMRWYCVSMETKCITRWINFLPAISMKISFQIIFPCFSSHETFFILKSQCASLWIKPSWVEIWMRFQREKVVGCGFKNCCCSNGVILFLIRNNLEFHLVCVASEWNYNSINTICMVMLCKQFQGLEMENCLKFITEILPLPSLCKLVGMENIFSRREMWNVFVWQRGIWKMTRSCQQ